MRMPRCVLVNYHSLKDGSLVLQKSEVVSKKLEKEFEHIQALSERSLKKIWDNDKDEIWNDYLKE
jgi:hypothetical protein